MASLFIQITFPGQPADPRLCSNWGSFYKGNPVVPSLFSVYGSRRGARQLIRDREERISRGSLGLTQLVHKTGFLPAPPRRAQARHVPSIPCIFYFWVNIVPYWLIAETLGLFYLYPWESWNWKYSIRRKATWNSRVASYGGQQIEVLVDK